MQTAPPVSRKIPVSRNDNTIGMDLDDLVSFAKSRGADQALLMQSRDVVFSPELAAPPEAEIRGNRSAHWPAVHPLDSIRDAVNAYDYGILLGFDRPSDMPDYGHGPITNPTHMRPYLRLHEILSAVESEAFYKSYHAAMGFGEGNCRWIFCRDEKRCMAVLKGRRCVRPYRARPSMAALGIDAPAMAKNIGIIEHDSMLLGLVMIV